MARIPPRQASDVRLLPAREGLDDTVPISGPVSVSAAVDVDDDHQVLTMEQHTLGAAMPEAVHVEVRPAELADVGSIQRIYTPYVTDTSITFEVEVPSLEDLRCRMDAQPRLPWLVAETESGVLGYAYAYPHSDRQAYRWTVNCSVYVDQAHHGRGVGRLLYGRLLDELSALGYVSVMARITLPNEPSVRLHESVGFTPVGVLEGVGFKGGRWHDVGWWSLRLGSGPSDHPSEPAEWTSMS